MPVAQAFFLQPPTSPTSSLGVPLRSVRSGRAVFGDTTCSDPSALKDKRVEHLHQSQLYESLGGSGTMFLGVLWPLGSCVACPLAQRVHSCLPTRSCSCRVFSQLFCWPCWVGVLLSDSPLLILAGITLPGFLLLLAFLSDAVRVLWAQF